MTKLLETVIFTEMTPECPGCALDFKLPEGTEVTGQVQEVGPDFVTFMLPNGLSAYLPRRYIEDAGHDYDAYTDCLEPSQRLDLIVSKVFPFKAKIRVDLASRH